MAQLLINPRKRRARKSPAKSKSRVRRAVGSVVARVKHRVKRYKRNPLPKMGDAANTVKNGAIGAAGAILSEIVLTKLPLPVGMQSGTGLILAKAMVGIGVGMLATKMSKDKSIGRKLAEGSVTIALHEAMRNVVKGPLGLSGLDEGMLGLDTGLLGYNTSTENYGSIDTDMGQLYSDGMGQLFSNDGQY